MSVAKEVKNCIEYLKLVRLTFKMCFDFPFYYSIYGFYSRLFRLSLFLKNTEHATMCVVYTALTTK